MRTTYNWLREYCPCELPVEELAHRLSMSGCLIEELEPAGDDTVMVAEITANRPDLLGMIGIAREVSALTGVPLRLPQVAFECGAETVASAASVEVRDPDLCPRYTARLVRDLRVGPSPDWLKARLEAVGVRPINNVVDVTNYVLFECGQPLHAFDFARLRGGKIIVRRAEDGECMMSIDETKCKLDTTMLVIADVDRSVAVAGIMGGLVTEISAATTDVLLESAQFENTNIRRTSRALGLASDSSYRFERGVDPVQTEWASRRAARLLQQVAGGTICEGVVDVWAEPYRTRTVALRPERMARVLGTPVPEDEARAILERLGFELQPETADGRIVVSVPPFRGQDVTREIDLIEEVIRIHGYDKIPEKGTLPITVGVARPAERVESLVRNTLVGLGFHEALTNTFCGEATARLISPWTDEEAVVVQNTVRRDENRLRVSLLPGLLTAKQTNVAHGVAQSPLFEISRVFLPKPLRTSGEPSRDDVLPEERQVVGILDEGDLLQLKGALARLLEAAGIETPASFEPAGTAFFEEGLSAKITLGGEPFGVIGQVSRAVTDRYDLPRSPCMAEVDFDLTVRKAVLNRPYSRIPAYPAAVRDLSVIVAEAVPWARIEESLRALEILILERIEFFDLFRGKQVPAGKKSIALSLTFRATDRTLTSAEVEEARQACIGALREIGAELRA